ncbi:MAG: hypothetical protein WA906_02585, partial [Pacificimonas sp.]
AEEASAAFGAENVVAGLGRAAASLDDITLTVADTETPRYGRTRIFFANGQIWEQKDERRMTLREGDQVVIERAPLSGYQLRKADKKRSVRVQRLR